VCIIFQRFCLSLKCSVKEVEGFPVIGHGSPQGCEMSRFLYFLDTQLTYGTEVISLTCRQAALCSPQEELWYSFLLEAESISGEALLYTEIEEGIKIYNEEITL
jgi:hypothetical protein